MTKTKPMTVGDLKKEINQFPDEMPIAVNFTSYGEQFDGIIDMIEEFEGKIHIVAFDPLTC